MWKWSGRKGDFVVFAWSFFKNISFERIRKFDDFGPPKWPQKSWKSGHLAVFGVIFGARRSDFWDFLQILRSANFRWIFDRQKVCRKFEKLFESLFDTFFILFAKVANCEKATKTNGISMILPFREVENGDTIKMKMGAFWRHFGRFWRHFVDFVRHLGPSWAPKGVPISHFWPPWAKKVRKIAKKCQKFWCRKPSKKKLKI